MNETLDIARVLEPLRQRDAPPALLAWVDGELTGTDLADPELLLEPPEELAFDDRELLLRALLPLLVEGAVRFAQVDGFREAARQLGFEEDWVEALVLEVLGCPLERVWATGVLGLQLDADLAAVKRAHRKRVKAVHPDRLVDADPAEQEAARARAADLNRARDVLRDHLDRPDDLPLVFVQHEDDDVDLEPLSDELARPNAPPSLGLDLEWLHDDDPTELAEDPTTDAPEALDPTESLDDRKPTRVVISPGRSGEGG